MTTWSYVIPPSVVTVTTAEDNLDPVNHVEVGLDYVLWQYKHCPRFLSYLEALLTAMQSIEDLAQDVRAAFNVEIAEGAQLDRLGAITGVYRPGEITDDEYRPYIQLQLKINRCTSKPDEILQIMEFCGAPPWLVETPPAAAWIEQMGIVYVEFARDVLTKIKPAGVRIDLVYSTYEEGFRFGNYDAAVVSTAEGWSSVYATATGGRWMGVL